MKVLVQFSSVQSLSSVDSLLPWTATRQASPCITNSWSLLKLMPTESVMPSNHLILCHPLLMLPLIFLNIRVFTNELAFHIKWPDSWSFSFSISPSNEYSELISFRIDWFDFLAVQRTLKSFLQHHISKASILWLSDFFVVQLTCVHKYWKTIVGQYGPLSAKWCLLFNTLSRFVIPFVPRSKRLLISCLQSPSAVIWEPKKIKSFTVSNFSSSIIHEVMGLDAMILWLKTKKPILKNLKRPQ